MQAALRCPRVCAPAARRRSLTIRAATALPADVRGGVGRAGGARGRPCGRAGPHHHPPSLEHLQVKTVTPVGDRVFVKAEEAEATTVGGILLPSSAQKRPTSGTVASAGGAKAVKARRSRRRLAAAAAPGPAP